MRNLARITNYYRQRVIEKWPAVAACASRKEALEIAGYLARHSGSGTKDWDVVRGRLAKKYCVVVPPEWERPTLDALRVAGFKGVF